MKRNKVGIILVCMLMLGVFLSIGLRISTKSIAYIEEGTVTGHITALPLYDLESYYVRLNEPGTLVVILEKEGFLVGTTFQVYDQHGILLGENKERYSSAQNISITVPESAFENEEYLEYQVNIKAFFGSGDYTLNILKPEDTLTDMYVGEVALYSIQKTQELQPKDLEMVITEQVAGIAGNSTLKATLLNKATKEEIVLTQAPQKVMKHPTVLRLPENLPDGEYNLILRSIRDDEGESWGVTHRNMPYIKAVAADLNYEIMQPGQTIDCTLNLTGQESDLWVIWKRALGSEAYDCLNASLVGPNGERMPLKRPDGNNTLIFSLDNALAGTYRLVINCKEKVSVGLGLELAGEFAALVPLSQKQIHRLISNQRYYYDVSRAPNGDVTKLITLLNRTQQPMTCKCNEFATTDSNTVLLQPGEAIPIPYEIILDTSRGIWLEPVEGELQVEFDLSRGLVYRADGFEDNDSFIKATPIEEGEEVNASISSSSDVDCYTFTVAEKTSVNLRLTNLQNIHEYNLELYDSSHTKIAITPYVGTRGVNNAKLLEPGTYYVKVWQEDWHELFDYNLTLEVVFSYQVFRDVKDTITFPISFSENSESVNLIIFPCNSPGETVTFPRISYDIQEEGKTMERVFGSIYTKTSAEQYMREVENQFVGNRPRQYGSKNLDDDKPLKIGDGRQFYISNLLSKEEQPYLPAMKKVSTTLKAQDAHCLIWVADCVTVDDSTIKAIKNEFENNIREKVIEYFGDEPVNTALFPVLKASGLKTNIVIAPLRKGTGGYFWGKDLYENTNLEETIVGNPNEYGDVEIKEERSNQRKVLFINSSTVSKEGYFNILAHEFQHMVFFNEKIVFNRRGIDTWINEGFSCLASDLVGYGYQYNKAIQDSARKYLNDTSSISLLNWTDKNYGASYLFVRYLFERFQMELEENLWDTRGIIKCVTRTNLQAQDALANQTHVLFEQLFEDWVITLFASSKDGVSYENRYRAIKIQAPASLLLRPGESWTKKEIMGWGVFYSVIQPYDKCSKIEITVMENKDSSIILLKRKYNFE